MTPFGRHPVDAELRTYIEAVRDGLILQARAERCDWNGTILAHQVTDDRGRVTAVGFAYRDGTMSLRTDLLDALREVWERPGVHQSGAALHRHQQAVHVPRHEMIHFLVPRTQRFYEGLAPYAYFAGRALEEGSTEVAAQNHAGICADRVESRSPGATDIRNVGIYPELAPAVRQLAAYVGRLRGESGRTIIDALARETASGKWERLSQLVLEARGLWDRIPEPDRPLCERVLREAVWNELSLNGDWAERDEENRLRTDDPEARSKIMGRQLVAALERRRLAIEYRYGTPSQPEVPWHVVAANYEQDLAQAALRDAARSQAPDVHQAASEWIRSAAQQPTKAIEAEHRPRQSPDEPDLHTEAVVSAVAGSVGAGGQAVPRARAYPPYRPRGPANRPGDRGRER